MSANVDYPTFLGVDLTSTEAKRSACVGLNSRSQLVYVGFLAKDTDTMALVDLYSPKTIAIEAPLSLPLELCCLEEGCSCKQESPRKNRQCAQELRRQGIPCYPTTRRTFIKALTYRGIELKTSIGSGPKQTSQVIEVDPFASKVRLLGATMPQKSTKQGIAFLRHKSGESYRVSGRI